MRVVGIAIPVPVPMLRGSCCKQLAATSRFSKTGIPSCRLFCTSSSAASSASSHQGPKSEQRSIAIIGSGLAGWSTCWHLLSSQQSLGLHSKAKCSPRRYGRVTLLDTADPFGSGSNSAVAAGLLHPVNASGRDFVWHGKEALEEAKAMMQAVAAQTARTNKHPTPGSGRDTFFERTGLVKIASDEKETSRFKRFASDPSVGVRQVRFTAPSASSPSQTFGSIFVEDCFVVDTAKYLENIARASVKMAEEYKVDLRLETERVSALDALLNEYDTVVVAAGAAFRTIRELKENPALAKLSARKGFTIECKVRKGESDAVNYSVMKKPLYIVRRLNKESRFVVGTVHEKGPAEPAEALTSESFAIDTAGSDNGSGGAGLSPSLVLAESLLSKARSIERAHGQTFRDLEATTLHSGVRLMSPRVTPDGARVPFLGRVDCKSSSTDRDGDVWLFLGLGSRGLLYHAYLGKMLAQALLQGDEEILPSEVKAWQSL